MLARARSPDAATATAPFLLVVLEEPALAPAEVAAAPDAADREAPAEDRLSLEEAVDVAEAEVERPEVCLEKSERRNQVSHILGDISGNRATYLVA